MRRNIEACRRNNTYGHSYQQTSPPPTRANARTHTYTRTKQQQQQHAHTEGERERERGGGGLILITRFRSMATLYPEESQQTSRRRQTYLSLHPLVLSPDPSQLSSYSILIRKRIESWSWLERLIKTLAFQYVGSVNIWRCVNRDEGRYWYGTPRYLLRMDTMPSSRVSCLKIARYFRRVAVNCSSSNWEQYLELASKPFNN